MKEDTDTLFPPRFMNILKDRLQQRMARADHPLEELYIIMRTVSTTLVLSLSLYERVTNHTAALLQTPCACRYRSECWPPKRKC